MAAATITATTAGATSTFRARQPGENQREAGTVGVAGVGRWELQELLVKKSNPNLPAGARPAAAAAAHLAVCAVCAGRAADG